MPGLTHEKRSDIFSAMHESYHAKQWLELGKEKYLKTSTLEREEWYSYSRNRVNYKKYQCSSI